MNNGWDGILDDDETILWQGRPDGAIVFRPANIMSAIFGLLFAGFALFWMIMASMAGGLFWMFGLLHFFVGLGIAGGGLVRDAWVRRHTHYSLSTKRAFIATDLPWFGRSLRHVPITPDVTINATGDGLTSIVFGREEISVRGKNGTRKRKVDIGFERLADADTVLRHLRKIEKRSQ